MTRLGIGVCMHIMMLHQSEPSIPRATLSRRRNYNFFFIFFFFIPFLPVRIMSQTTSLNQFDVASTLASLGAYQPLFKPDNFLSNAVTLLLIGFIIVVYFISYQVTHKTNNSRSLVVELALASMASVLLGTGAVMAMLASGLYV